MGNAQLRERGPFRAKKVGRSRISASPKSVESFARGEQQIYFFLATVFFLTAFFATAFLAGAFFAGAFLAGFFLTGISIPPFPSAIAGRCEDHVNNSICVVNSSLLKFRQRIFLYFRLIFFGEVHGKIMRFARGARFHQPLRRSRQHSTAFRCLHIRKRAFLPRVR